MRTRQLVFCWAVVATGFLAVGMSSPGPVSLALAQQGGQPQNFEQILPRGRIASIDQPVFVDAAVAKVLPESWVLGVMIDGQARAFSLAVLNSHEIVNDSIGETNYAAVW